MIDDLKYKEGAILSLLKELGTIEGQSNLFSLMYLAQEYLGCRPHFAGREAYDCTHGMSFYIDAFGISSNEMRGVLEGLEREGKIKVTPSNELDPEFLVSKRLIYSIADRGENNASYSDCLKGPPLFEENAMDKLRPFLELKNLAGVIYLFESSVGRTGWEKSGKADYVRGERLGIEIEEVERGFELMNCIGGIRKTPPWF